jgi:hypothetical protein
MVEGTIYLINAKFKYKKKVYKLLDVVWKYQGNNQYTRMRVLDKIKVKQPVTLYDIEIIKKLGHENTH